ncbi:DUF3224 domain-containing protein [Micromonospora echinospora]|uniref:DUF3224 domain-containing protein n=1 Tax=Micromonospora echinospora TaxID=1877 RepID=UPI003A887E6C
MIPSGGTRGVSHACPCRRRRRPHLGRATALRRPRGRPAGPGRRDQGVPGDLQASSVAHLLKAESARPGSGGYVGLERVVGTLHGRPGSFVLQHCGVMDRGAGSLTIQVVPDTGTGELAGLTGTMEILLVDGERGFTFDYTVES